MVGEDKDGNSISLQEAIKWIRTDVKDEIKRLADEQAEVRKLTSDRLSNVEQDVKQLKEAEAERRGEAKATRWWATLTAGLISIIVSIIGVFVDKHH